MEYAGKAIENSGTCVGLRCKDGYIFGAEKLVVSKLLVAGTSRRIHPIGRNYALCTAGLSADCRQLVVRGRAEAASWQSLYGTPIPTHTLAERIASYIHQHTLFAWMRPFGAAVLVAGWDEEKGYQVFSMDPAGLCYGYKGAALGKAASSGKNELEKLQLDQLTAVQAVQEVASGEGELVATEGTYKVLAAAGIATVAISFAAQTSISNVISGIFLIFDRPFVIGDTVKVDQTLGTVAEIGLLSSKIRTFDNLLVRLPNEAMLKATITNYSAMAIRRIDVPFRVGFDADIEQIQEVVGALMLAHPMVLDEPAPIVLTDLLGESSVALIARAWIVREDFVQAKSDLSIELVKKLRELGVTLPPPLHVSTRARD